MSITAMHAYADQLESARVGYSQSRRWSFNPARDGRTVVPLGDGDCSSTSAAIAKNITPALDTSDPIWTGNLASKLAAVGWTRRTVSGMRLSDLIAAAHPGSIIVGPGHAVYVRARNRWWSAESDERGKSSGGQPGDQTGLEARFRQPYARSKGWADLLIPPAESLVATTPLPEQSGVAPVKPRAVDWQSPPAELTRIVQRIVGVTVDGVRGAKTKAGTRSLQRKLGVRADSLFGPGTAEQFLLAQPNLYAGQRRAIAPGAVALLQWIVRSRPDDKLGPLTTSDVMSAQAWAGLDPDGNAGADTKRRITF